MLAKSVPPGDGGDPHHWFRKRAVQCDGVRCGPDDRQNRKGGFSGQDHFLYILRGGPGQFRRAPGQDCRWTGVRENQRVSVYAARRSHKLSGEFRFRGPEGAGGRLSDWGRKQEAGWTPGGKKPAERSSILVAIVKIVICTRDPRAQEMLQ